MTDQLENWLAIIATHFENLILSSVLWVWYRGATGAVGTTPLHRYCSVCPLHYSPSQCFIWQWCTDEGSFVRASSKSEFGNLR